MTKEVRGDAVPAVDGPTRAAAPPVAILEELLDAPTGDVREAMGRAAGLLAEYFQAHKVDVWLREGDLLRAAGVSDTPMGRHQVALGLDRFAHAEQTRVWDVVDSGAPYLTGRADLDEGVHPGIRGTLGVRSMAGVPLEVRGERRGALLLSDARPDRFTRDDLRIAAAVARWVGLVVAQAEAAEAAVRHAAAEAEHRTLHDLLMGAPPLFALLSGPDLVFTFANASYQRLFPGRRLLGLPLREAVPELEGQGLLELLGGVFRSGEPVDLPEQLARLDRGDGALEDGYFSVRFEATRGPSGEITGVLVSGNEVTTPARARRAVERLAAEAAQQRRLYEGMLDASPDHVFALDPAGRFVYVNRAAAAVIGAATGGAAGTPDRIAGRTGRELGLDEAFLAHFEPNHQRAMAGETAVAETLFPTQSGPRSFEYVLSPVPGEDGRPELAVGITRDVQERREAEAERERLLRAERDARAEAEAAVQARDQFLSIASHELRTPLTTVRGTAQLMQRFAARGMVDPERFAQTLEGMVTSVGRLGRLVDDLLDVSRLRTGQLPLRPVPLDLDELVRQAAERARAQATGHSVRAEVGCTPCTVMADPDRLHQVVDNLMENALKYSPEGGEVAITLEHEGEDIVLRVSDQGIGLPPGTEERVFQPFGRVPNAAAAGIPGMGLGLYVCRQIAEAHGGTMRTHSEGEGRGTTFTLRLPTGHQLAAAVPGHAP